MASKMEATAETTWFISHGEDDLSSFLLFYFHHFGTTSLSFPRLWSISVSVTYNPRGRKLVAVSLSQSYTPIPTYKPHQNCYSSFMFVSEMMKLKVEHVTTPCSRCLPERRFKFYKDWDGGREQETEKRTLGGQCQMLSCLQWPKNHYLKVRRSTVLSTKCHCNKWEHIAAAISTPFYRGESVSKRSLMSHRPPWLFSIKARPGDYLDMGGGSVHCCE